jgi:hypothetical protein
MITDFNKEIDLYMNRVIIHSDEMNQEERDIISKFLTKQRRLLSSRISNYMKGIDDR